MMSRKTLDEAKIVARTSDPEWLGEELFRLQEQAADRDAIRASLLAILDAVDYKAGNCRVNDMVGAVLPNVLIERAREALKK